MEAEHNRGRGVLVSISDSSGVIWSATASPVSSLVHAMQTAAFPIRAGYELWADQAGIAMAMLAQRIGIVRCCCRAVSCPGKSALDSYGIPVLFDEVIDLVYSSNNLHSACPIELGLLNGNETERWAFLTQRYGEIPSACS